jgi:hypothetical protein
VQREWSGKASYVNALPRPTWRRDDRWPDSDRSTASEAA